MRARRVRRRAARSGSAPRSRKGIKSGLTIRSFREGDEAAIARLYNTAAAAEQPRSQGYAAGFVGPEPLTPRSWRGQFRHQGWSAPALDADRECVRLAVQRGELVGYAVTNYRYEFDPNVSVVQELCTMEVDDADGVAEALLTDAERLARARGKHVLMLSLSNEDGRIQRAAGRAGFDSPEDGGSVFMAAITSRGAAQQPAQP